MASCGSIQHRVDKKPSDAERRLQITLLKPRRVARDTSVTRCPAGARRNLETIGQAKLATVRLRAERSIQLPRMALETPGSSIGTRGGTSSGLPVIDSSTTRST